MALSDLPEPLRGEVQSLRHAYALAGDAVGDEAILTATVRGVPLFVLVPLDDYPAAPPRLQTQRPVRLRHPYIRVDRKGFVRGLDCVRRWNRTLGLGAPLRELDRCFREHPPEPARPSWWRRLLG